MMMGGGKSRLMDELLNFLAALTAASFSLILSCASTETGMVVISRA